MPAGTVSFTLRSAASWRDPWSMYAALRDLDPVHHVVDGDYWVLTRYADVFRAARDTATFSSAQGLTVTYGDMSAAGLDDATPMVMLDPPAHTDFRRLVAKGFTPRRVADIEPAVRRYAIERIEALRDAGGGDLVAALAKPLPSFVVAHYLGVPEGDRARFDDWTAAIVAANATGDLVHTSHAVAELFGYFSELLERRRAEPTDDPDDTISRLAHAEVVAGGRAGGGPTSEVPALAILGFAFTMVAGGNDTATGLIAGAAELLSAHPVQRSLLAADPSLIPGAVEELLRLLSPVQGLARTTTEDVQLHGVTIPSGRKVLLAYGSANRDPREFGPDADALDVTRDLGHHLAFGSGAHHCLGAAVARLQGRVVLEELLARCPDFSVDPDAGRFAPGSYVRRYESLPFVVA